MIGLRKYEKFTQEFDEGCVLKGSEKEKSAARSRSYHITAQECHGVKMLHHHLDSVSIGSWMDSGAAIFITAPISPPFRTAVQEVQHLPSSSIVSIIASIGNCGLGVPTPAPIPMLPKVFVWLGSYGGSSDSPKYRRVWLVDQAQLQEF